MTWPPLRAVLIGMGKIGAGYAEDPVMAQHYPYATHAQVLAAHPAFTWEAIVEVAEPTLEAAQARWNIPIAVQQVQELKGRCQPDVAVLATPPQARLEILAQLPGVRAVIVEKPLGATLEESQRFLQWCQERQILVQVNLLRRADAGLRTLASGQLTELIGTPQAVFGLYGNGLLNNGTHMVDLVRMLLGDIQTVQAVTGVAPAPAGPIPGDVHLPFTLTLQNGLVVAMQPLNFEHYRENSLDLWGDRGRLFLAYEGLGVFFYPKGAHRSLQGAEEIDCDRPSVLTATIGQALYQLYDNLVAALYEQAPLWSSGISALQTTRVMAAIVQSASQNGAAVTVG